MIDNTQKAELHTLISLARRKAAKVGPLHSMWDVILDGEALLKDRPTRCSPDSIFEELRKFVDGPHPKNS